MRIEQLNFTRFIAAISIVVFHFGSNLFPFNTVILYPFCSNAIGVSFFFMLSGFIMIIAYQCNEKIKAITFWINRFSRIYPSYILGLVFMIFYKIILAKEEILNTDLLLYLSGTQSWLSDYALILNLPGWSLSIEIFFYALFPLIFYLIKHVKFSTTIFGIIFFWALSLFALNYFALGDYNINNKLHNFLLYFPLLHLNEFLIGNLAGLLFLNYHKRYKSNYDIHIIGLVFLTGLFVSLDVVPDYNYTNGLMAVFLIPLILLISLNNGYITKLFNLKIFILLGEISYGIYIFHYPVFKAIKYIGFQNKNIEFTISLLCLLLICIISYYSFETPLRKLIRRIYIKNK